MNIVQGAIPPSAGAITLINTSGYTITLSVDEKDITQLAGRAARQPERAGASAMLRVTGTVTRIDPAPTLSGQLVNYDVR